MKKLVILFIFLLSSSIISQNKVSNQEVENTFKLIFQNPDEAYIKLIDLEKRSSNQSDSLHGIVLGHIGVYYAVKSDFDNANNYFDNALKNLDTESKAYINTQKNKAIIYKKQGQLNKAISLLKLALTKALKKKNDDSIAIIYGELGSCYAAKEEFEKALNYLIKSIQIWEKVESKNSKKIAVEKQKLANLYFKMNNANYALSIYKEIIPIFKLNADFYNAYLCQITEANIYLHLNNPKKALLLLDEALIEIKKFDNKELILYANERKAKALQSLDKKKESLDAYKKAFVYGLKHEQIRTVYTFIELGNLMISEGQWQELKQYIVLSEQKQFQILLKLSTTEDKKRYYDLRIKYYEKKGDQPEKVLLNKKTRDSFDIELKSKYDVHKIREKQAEYRMKLAENEKTIAAQKLENEKIKLILVSIFGLFLLITGLSIYYKSKIKQQFLKTNLEKTKLEKSLVQKEIEIQKEISSEQLITIKKQEQELLAQTLEKVEADKLLANTLNEIRNDLSPKKIKQIEAINKSSTLYWKNVLEKFNYINPTFNQSLLEQYPQLSKGDRDFCSFVKLNLSNKEIAHLLQISPESVITKKYRIVKKLNLPKEVDFQHWLSEII